MEETRSINPALVLPEDTLGPHMLALSERQRAFVAACLTMNGINHSRAAAEAGYQGNSNTLAVTGHRLAHNSLVIEAIREEADRRLKSSAIMAVSVMVDIAQSVKSSDKDRLKAAEMIANRVGLHAKSEHKVVTEDASTTDAAMKDRIKALCTQLNIDPKTLLGSMAKDVTPPSAPIVDGSQGLEDLL